ncbi:transposase [Dactylosporangium sp. NPDC000244]|uniref:transposase n=1 Tax=Dactylosporangium sp. NPDC000244 TaxID=3154365 RepID=UPI00331B2578
MAPNCTAADRRSRPVSRTITAGQRHDRIGYPAVMAGIRMPRRHGRPRTRPARILGDNAYSISAIRADLRRRGIAATNPERADQQANRRKHGAAGGQPPALDAERYKQRNTVERAVGKLKQFRAVATRYDKERLHVPGHHRHRHHQTWLRDLTADPRDTPSVPHQRLPVVRMVSSSTQTA